MNVYEQNIYRATLVRVTDGDTVVLAVDLGLRTIRKIPIRLVGIDAPEVRGEEKEAGYASKDALKKMLEGQRILVKFRKGKSFDRWLGMLFLDLTEPPDEEASCILDVQAEMVKQGHAEPADD